MDRYSLKLKKSNINMRRKDTLLPTKPVSKSMSRLKHEEIQINPPQVIAPMKFGTTSSGWKAFFLGLIAPFDNSYKQQINKIVKTSNQESEVQK